MNNAVSTIVVATKSLRHDPRLADGKIVEPSPLPQLLFKRLQICWKMLLVSCKLKKSYTALLEVQRDLCLPKRKVQVSDRRCRGWF